MTWRDTAAASVRPLKHELAIPTLVTVRATASKAWPGHILGAA